MTDNRNEGVKVKSNRGFARMDVEQQREIASKGGRAAHAQGKAHKWNSEEARAAGRKGGHSSGKTRTDGSEADNKKHSI